MTRPAVVPFRTPNFARVLELRKLEAELRADVLAARLLDALKHSQRRMYAIAKELAHVPR